MEHEVKAKVQAEIEQAEEAEVRDVLEAFVTLTLKDRDGRVKEQREFRARSFLRQWLEFLNHQMNAGPRWPGTVIRDTSNVQRNIIGYYTNFRADALAADYNYGILVGAGITAPTLSDYAMESLILHGIAAGQLQYSNMAISLPAINANVSHVTLTRDFANGSPGAVTVNEVGLALIAYDATFNTRYVLVIRDVVGGGMAVPAGETLTVNYRIQATI